MSVELSYDYQMFETPSGGVETLLGPSATSTGTGSLNATDEIVALFPIDVIGPAGGVFVGAPASLDSPTTSTFLARVSNGDQVLTNVAQQATANPTTDNNTLTISFDIRFEFITDCDGNGVDDAIDLVNFLFIDPNCNGVIDSCEGVDFILDVPSEYATIQDAFEFAASCPNATQLQIRLAPGDHPAPTSPISNQVGIRTILASGDASDTRILGQITILDSFNLRDVTVNNPAGIGLLCDPATPGSGVVSLSRVVVEGCDVGVQLEDGTSLLMFGGSIRDNAVGLNFIGPDASAGVDATALRLENNGIGIRSRPTTTAGQTRVDLEIFNSLIANPISFDLQAFGIPDSTGVLGVSFIQNSTIIGPPPIVVTEFGLETTNAVAYGGNVWLTTEAEYLVNTTATPNVTTEILFNAVHIPGQPRSIVPSLNQFAFPDIRGDLRLASSLGPDGLPFSGDEDYRLTPGSAAIDAGYEWGNNIFGFQEIFLDIDGLPHNVDDPRVSDLFPANSSSVRYFDAGAFEFQLDRGCSVADLTTTNTNPGDAFAGVPDGVIDGADLSFYVEKWLALDQAIADLATTNTNPGEIGFGEPDGAVDGADLSFLVEQWLGGCP